MKLQIITPERMVLDIDVDEIILPGIHGEIGVLPAHAALISALAPGELRWSKDKKFDDLVIGGGFADIIDDKVTVVTDVALKASEIDESSVEAAILAAQEALRGISTKEAEEAAMIEARLAKSIAILQFKRKLR